MSEPLLVKGFSDILSRDVIDSNIDIKSLEQEYLGQHHDNSAYSAEQLRKRLAATADALDIEVAGLTPVPPTGSPGSIPFGQTPVSQPYYGRQSTPIQPRQATPFPQAPPEIMSPKIMSHYTPPSYGAATEEENQRSKINNVMNSMSADNNPGMSFAAEKARDEKLQLLAEIDDLRDQLIAANSNIDGIRNVDEQSSYEEVLAVRNILRFKDDRIKYSALACELIMFVAYGIEHVFNGEREFFGYKVDMRGWSDHVQVKLRRMRSDLSNVTSSIFQDYNIPSWARITVELIPSAVMYSKTKRQNQPYLDPNDDATVEAATARLRDLQSRTD